MINNGKNVMRNVKIEKSRLLETIKDNLEKHIELYNESVEDYKALVLKIYTNNLKIAKTGNLDKFSEMKNRPVAPESHEAEYKRAIKMLEFEVDEIVEIDETTFNQLVLDEWSWKENFVSSSAFYKSAL